MEKNIKCTAVLFLRLIFQFFIKTATYSMETIINRFTTDNENSHVLYKQMFKHTFKLIP